MPVNLSVKNVPDELAEQLRQRAAANRRSLQRELLSILEAAVGSSELARVTSRQRPPRDAITADELGAISRQLFPKGTSSSVGFIRQLRDKR